MCIPYQVTAYPFTTGSCKSLTYLTLLGRIKSDNNNEANNSKLIEILTNATNVLVSLGNNDNNDNQ